VRLEALGECRTDDAERLVRLVRELVEVMVEEPEEHQRPDADRGRRVRATLEVANGDAARGREERDPCERDQIGARR